MSQFIAPRPQLLRIKPAKPRNPLVAPCLMRQAGRHDSARHAQRQSAQKTLRQELQRLSEPPSP